MIEFVVGLADKVSGPAQTASRNITTLADRMKSLESNAKSLEKQMTKASALGDHEKVAKLSVQHTKLVDALDKSSVGTSSFSSSLAGLSAELGPALMILGAYAAVIGGVVAALVAGGAIALSAAAFKNETMAAFTALSGSAKVGEETLGIIRELEKSVPETEMALVERAKGLLAMGLDTKSLKGALRDISNVSAAFGESGANAITKVIEKTLSTGKLKLMPKQLIPAGISEKDLAAELGMTPKVFEQMMKSGAIGADKGLAALHSVIEKKMGGLASEKMMSLPGLMNKLGDNIKHLFEDVNTRPFLEGLKGIIDLFDTTKASGQAMKWVIEAVFNTGFKKSGSVLLTVKHGIQDLIIGGLKLYIALKPSISQFKTLWAQAKNSDKLKMALLGVAIVVGVIVGVIALGAAAMLGIGAAVVAVIAIIVVAIGLAIGFSIKLSEAVRKKLMAWPAIAKNAAVRFIEGLVEGLAKGVTKVQAAAKLIAGVIPKALRDKLEIKSPSRVAVRIGEQVPAGLAEGEEKGLRRVGVAATKLGARAVDGIGGDRDGKRGSGGGGVHVDKIEVNNSGVDSEGKAIRMTATSLADVLELLALKEGLGLT